jgi:D-amino-acid dehydrogenase
MTDGQHVRADRTAVVVGAGVIGAACAYYLARSGWKVTVVDRGGFGSGCSHGNCGMICPSHVLPLAAPGATREALRSLFRRDSPLAIRLRFDPGLWGWLYRFWKRCNVRDMMDAAHGIHALLDSSRALYDQLIQTEGMDCEWETRGLLYVLRTQTGRDQHAATDRLLRESFGVSSMFLDGDALVTYEPALKPGLAGGWLYPGDAHLRPDRLLSCWRSVLERLGVEVREGCEVRGFVREGGKARAVSTAQGELAAEGFVVATGVMTPFLGKALGCKVPIQPGKGYSITMPRPSRCPTVPMILEEDRVAVTPLRSGYRLGSTMEFAGFDATLNRHRLDLLTRGAAHYLHEPVVEPVEEEWFGWRPMTYDGKPIIDRSPALHNVILAAGHNTLGMSLAPATGKLVAELLDGQAVPHIDPRPYAVDRFS